MNTPPPPESRPDPAETPLGLSSEQMRELGYQAIDSLVEYFTGVRDQSVVPPAAAAARAPALQAISAHGTPFPQLLEEAHATVFGEAMNLIHPRFFAYIPGAANFVSVIGDLLASGHNVFAGTSPHNEGPSAVEADTIRWLADIAGMGAAAGGLFVSGGSAASLTALTVARHRQLADDVTAARVYVTTQTHHCVARALFVLGFRESQLHVVPHDRDFRMEPAALRAAIVADRAAGARPFCVVGSAGTTNTGAVDPLADLADICAREGLWFHVDAAYGGGALLADSVRAQFDGIEAADTIAIDPHKWLFQPFECACVLARDENWFLDTFRRLPDYMHDTDAPRNYRDMGIQITRSFKAFKLWFSLRAFGVDAFRSSVEYGLQTARDLQRLLEASPDWQVVTAAALGVVTCRFAPTGVADTVLDGINRAISDIVTDEGFAFLSTTILDGRRVIRLCPIHPLTTTADLAATLERMTDAGHQQLDAHRGGQAQ